MFILWRLRFKYLIILLLVLLKILLYLGINCNMKIWFINEYRLIIIDVNKLGMVIIYIVLEIGILLNNFLVFFCFLLIDLWIIVFYCLRIFYL